MIVASAHQAIVSGGLKAKRNEVTELNRKVVIAVSKSRYHKSHKNGSEFTSVCFSASTYGSSSPCDTHEQVKSAIESCKQWIREEGDIPIVENLAEKRTLKEWF